MLVELSCDVCGNFWEAEDKESCPNCNVIPDYVTVYSVLERDDGDDIDDSYFDEDVPF